MVIKLYSTYGQRQRPIRFFLGLGRTCENAKGLKSRYGKCVPTCDSSFSSGLDLYNQAVRGCAELIKEMFADGKIKPEFEFGFHLYGRSQGGLIARLVLHICHEIRPYIKRVATVGTPNMGINEYPKIPGCYGCLVGLLNCLVSCLPACMLEDKISARQYLNKISYNGLETSFEYADLINFLLCNEVKSDARYKEPQEKIYSSLEGVVAFMFVDDAVIIPNESTLFQDIKIQALSETSRTDLSAPDSVLAKSGLEGLWNENRLVSCSINSKHDVLSDTELDQIIRFFNDEGFCENRVPNHDNYKECFLEKITFIPKSYSCKAGPPETKKIFVESNHLLIV
jgi:hypothetical protein